MKSAMAIVGTTILSLAVIIGLAIGVFFLQQQVRRWIAPVEGETERIEAVNSVEFRMRAYNHFFDLCVSVQNAEQTIDNAFDTLEAVRPDVRFYNTYVLNFNAAKQARTNGVNQYNADARKDWTEGNFLDEDLPWQIGLDYQPHGRRTVCATS